MPNSLTFDMDSFQGERSLPNTVYYAANLGGQFTFNDVFSASGKASLSDNGNIFLGFFDSANACFSSLCNGGAGRAQSTAVGWLVDFTGTFGIISGTGWQDGMGSGSTPNGQFDWSISYDPAAGSDGQLSMTFAGLSATGVDIGLNRRNSGAVFDRFGLAGGNDIQPGTGSFDGSGPLFIDDVT